MAYKLNKAGLDLIKKWEGYHTRLPNGDCKAYLDKLVKPAYRSPGYAGLWTIGYGCTAGVYEGLVWTEKQAEAALKKEIATHEAAINRLLSERGISVDDNQFAALVSLSYNVGSGSVASSSILKHLKAGNEQAAADAFLLYKKAGGRVVKGLLNRRNDERTLFLKHTPKQVVESSRKLTLLQRIRNFLSFSGVAGIFSWNFWTDAKSFISDNSGLILLGVVAVAFIAFKLVEWYSIDDYEKGRYTPSGVANDVE